ncbi:hypothetical protein [Pseudomonas gingeri]|uniref:Uncharacterized protein n=1 Tax=Pseudomonas gingeri TaxID=117681 RepID=A0A7Y7WG53_9PSED|nr:hypothetical protein [Pseudomonas gingeri]NWB48805.1 hypothetical protein [Pseudomonas gingeri]
MRVNGGQLGTHRPLRVINAILALFQTVFQVHLQTKKYPFKSIYWVINSAHPGPPNEAKRSPPCTGFVASGLLIFRASPAATRPTSRSQFAGDIDTKALGEYFQRRFRQSPEQTGLETIRILENLGLANGGTPNLAGLLLFGQAPQRLCPAFDIKAVAFPGTVLHDRHYLDSEDIDGNLLDRALSMLGR